MLRALQSVYYELLRVEPNCSRVCTMSLRTMSLRTMNFTLGLRTMNFRAFELTYQIVHVRVGDPRVCRLQAGRVGKWIISGSLRLQYAAATPIVAPVMRLSEITPRPIPVEGAGPPGKYKN